MKIEQNIELNEWRWIHEIHEFMEMKIEFNSTLGVKHYYFYLNS